jgi:protein TonB
MPVPLYRQQPRYTAQAMRARLEGEVMVQCVVLPSGECTQLRVLRSLDARLGLDEEALRAAAGWRFSPGMRQGKAVPVLVTILVGFSIH